MPTPIQIAELTEDKLVIRPISNYFEFEHGVFGEQTSFYFDDKTDLSNPFLACIEIKHGDTTHWINYKLFGEDNVKLISAENNRVLYSCNDFDIEYIVSDGQLKENIILHHPIDKREFKFTLKLSEFLQYRLENNEVIFFDIRTNENLLKIPAPSMEDAVGNESNNLSYSFSIEGECKSLSVVINDEDFMNQAIYPVVIDPTTISVDVSISTGGKLVRDSQGNVYFSLQVSGITGTCIRKLTSAHQVHIWNGTDFVLLGTGTEVAMLQYSIWDMAITTTDIIWFMYQSGYGVYYATFNLGTKILSAGTQVAVTGISTYYAQTGNMAIDASNRVLFNYTYYDSPGSRYWLYYRIYNGTSLLTETQLYSTSTNIAPYFSSAYSGGNSIYVYWSDYATPSKIRLRALVSGSMSGVINLYSTGTNSQSGYGLTVTADNRVHLFWRETDDTKVHHSISTNNGTTWTHNFNAITLSGATSSVWVTSSGNSVYLFASIGTKLICHIYDGVSWSSENILVSGAVYSLGYVKNDANSSSRTTPEVIYRTNSSPYQLTYVEYNDPPSNPTNLRVESRTVDTITFNWDYSGIPPEGYKIYKDGVAVKTVTSKPATLTGITPNASSNYYVTAYNTYGELPSNTLSNIKTHTLLQGTGLSSKIIKWTWNAVPTATQYKIYATQADFLADINPVGIISAPTLEFYERNLPTPNQSYTRYIKAFNGNTLADLSVDDSNNPLGALASTLPVLVAPTDNYKVQYRAILNSLDGVTTPTLDSISLSINGSVVKALDTQAELNQSTISNITVNSNGTANLSFDDAVPTMTVNTVNGVTVASNSTYGSNYAWNAFKNDGTTSNFNATAYAMPVWVSIDFGIIKAIRKYTITSTTSLGDRYPKTWQFQGWNTTTSSWDTLHSYTENSSWGTSGTKRTYTTDEHANIYSKYQIYITDYWEASSNYNYRLAISEMELLSADGTITFNAVDVSSQQINSSSLSWNATTPANTSISFETRISGDGGTTWGAWKPIANSGDSIPDLVAGGSFADSPTSTSINYKWLDNLNQGVTHYQILEGFDTGTLKNTTLTKGSLNSIDSLPDPNVKRISSISGYIIDVDYKLTNNGIDWSLGGKEPSVGSTYSVNYIIPTNDGADDYFEVRGENAGTIVNGIVTVPPAKTFTETNLRYNTPYQRYVRAVRKVSSISGSGLTTDDDEYVISAKSSITYTTARAGLNKSVTFTSATVGFTDTCIDTWSVNGTGFGRISLDIGKYYSNPYYYRAYLKYPILEDMYFSTITSANLRMYLNAISSNPIQANIGIYECTSSMNPSSVTWNSQPTIDATPITTYVSPTGDTKNVYKTFNITGLVQRHVSSLTYPNNGFLVKEASEADCAGRGFNGLSASSNKPDLTIAYTTMPSPFAPTSFIGAIVNSSTIQWSWTVPEGYSKGYMVYDTFNNLLYKFVLETGGYKYYNAIKQSNGTYTFDSGVHIDQDTSTTIAFNETDLSMGAIYSRYVVAYNDTGESQASNTTSVMLGYYDPKNFIGTPTNYKTVTWTWEDTQNTGVDYEIYDASNNLITTITAEDVIANGKVWVETGYQPNETKTRKILATDGSLDSGLTQGQGTSTDLLPPSNIVATVLSSSKIIYTFDQYLDVVKYYIWDWNETTQTATKIATIMKQGNNWNTYMPNETTLLETNTSPKYLRNNLSAGTQYSIKISSSIPTYDVNTTKSAKVDKTTTALDQINSFTGEIVNVNDITWKIDR